MHACDFRLHELARKADVEATSKGGCLHSCIAPRLMGRPKYTLKAMTVTMEYHKEVADDHDLSFPLSTGAEIT